MSGYAACLVAEQFAPMVLARGVYNDGIHW